MRIQAAEDLIAPAVNDTIQQLDLRPEDHAAARLAQRYAAAIDGADDPAETLEKLGPKLLTALESLGASPAARARIMKGTPAGGAPTRLQALRAAR